MSPESQTQTDTQCLDPPAETFIEWADQRPVVCRVEATLDVSVEPLAAYTTLSENREYSFLLESAEKVQSSDPDGAFAPGSPGRHARFSFVGYDPAAAITVESEQTSVSVCTDRYTGVLDPDGENVVDALRTAMPDIPLRGFPDRKRQHLDGGLVGFLSYEAVYDLSLSALDIDRPDTAFPDAQFVLNTKTLVFDHTADTVSLVFTPVLREGEDAGAVYEQLQAEAARVESRLDSAETPETGGFRRADEQSTPREEYEKAVERAREAVHEGSIYQGVISRKRELYGEIDPVGFYEALRETNPSPYMYLLSQGRQTLVGASPETLVSVSDGRVVANPIAGTCRRGATPPEDRRLAGELLADDKERAEHTMLVDLARNDVRRVAESGSVRVEEFMNVLKYAHVQHIESTVTGKLAADCDVFDAVRATFPAGTLTGAPKIRAMELIDRLESGGRGPYGGGVGYVSWQGDSDFAIVIRSGTVERLEETDSPHRITVQAGAGIVADSDPEAEYEETRAKIEGVLAALEQIQQGDTR